MFSAIVHIGVGNGANVSRKLPQHTAKTKSSLFRVSERDRVEVAGRVRDDEAREQDDDNRHRVPESHERPCGIYATVDAAPVPRLPSGVPVTQACRSDSECFGEAERKRCRHSAAAAAYRRGEM